MCFIFRNLISNYIMLFWTIKITVISIIFIFLVHYLINFFKSVLTVPKIKDLVNSPNKKYESMYNTIKNYERNKSSEINSNEGSWSNSRPLCIISFSRKTITRFKRKNDDSARL